MHFDVLKSAQDTADMHNLKPTQLKKKKTLTHIFHY